MTGAEGAGRPALAGPGVHRVLGPAGPVAAELAHRGWDVALVPAAETDADLWDGFAGALDLPGWFGRNLDALDEVLRDRVRPDRAGPRRLEHVRPRPARAVAEPPAPAAGLGVRAGPWAAGASGRPAAGRLVLLTD